MKNLKLLSAILVFLVLLLILILIRSTDQNLFKRDAAKALAPVEEITLSIDDLESYKDTYSVVVLDSSNADFANSIYIPFERIVDKENLKKLKNLEGDILLFAHDISFTSRAWVILNQLNFDRLIILSNQENPELLNYKFQPDTTAGLEFESLQN